MSLYEYVLSSPSRYVDPMGLQNTDSQEFCCMIDKDGKRVQTGGTRLTNQQIHDEVMAASGLLAQLFHYKDIKDFGADIYAEGTYKSFTQGKVQGRLQEITTTEDRTLSADEAAIVKNDIVLSKANILERVREGVIDCFVDQGYFDEYLAAKHNALSSFEDMVILARGIYSETTQYDISVDTKILLGAVIKNRKNLPNYANTYLGVLEQPVQFEGWPDKAEEYSKMSGKAQKLNWALSYAAGVLVDGVADDPSNGADHFYSPYIEAIRRPPWARNATPVETDLRVDYIRNYWYRDAGQYFHGATFIFLDLIDDQGHWR
jgi:hypothetical protein